MKEDPGGKRSCLLLLLAGLLALAVLAWLMAGGGLRTPNPVSTPVEDEGAPPGKAG
ncbi:MAG TPA: hypothetical protein VNT25_01130 [Allosphingosinicella sp.]|nr:hypothetical protein [Allosphingosinicella sp.]